MAVLAPYLSALGTDSLKKQQLEQAWQRISTTMTIDVDNKTFSLSLTGPDSQLKPALELLAHFMRSAKGDDEALKEAKNADNLPKIAKEIESLDVTELIVSLPMKKRVHIDFPTKEKIKNAAVFIRDYEKNRSRGKPKISVHPCFSQLRAVMGGENPVRNGNRGIEKGCGAGRDHFCVTASGQLAPCIYADTRERCDSLGEYWENSPALIKLREESGRSFCGGCRYERRCLPCSMLEAMCSVYDNQRRANDKC